jgi:hypothetical protein
LFDGTSGLVGDVFGPFAIAAAGATVAKGALLFEDGSTLEVEADVRGGRAFLGGKVRGKENEEEGGAHGRRGIYRVDWTGRGEKMGGFCGGAEA